MCINYRNVVMHLVSHAERVNLQSRNIDGEASAKLKTSRLPKQMGSTSPEHIQKGNES